MTTILSRFVQGGFNRIIPLTFIALAAVLAVLVYRVRYRVYKKRKERYAAETSEGMRAAGRAQRREGEQ